MGQVKKGVLPSLSQFDPNYSHFGRGNIEKITPHQIGL